MSGQPRRSSQSVNFGFRSPYLAPRSTMLWEYWSEWQDLNLRPPRPERGALPDCATLRLPEGRPYNRVPPAPQAQVSSMTAPPATRVIKAQATKDGALKGGATAAELAARALTAGGLVAFPTETVYGLSADATNAEAV